jgi:hypothetical protein
VFDPTILQRVVVGSCAWYIGRTRAALKYSVASSGYRMAKRQDCYGSSALHYCGPFEHEVEDNVDAIITMRCRCISVADPQVDELEEMFPCAEPPAPDDIGYVLVFAYACPSETQQARFYVEFPVYDNNGEAYCTEEDFYLTAGATRAGWYAYFKANQCVSELVFKPICASAGKNADAPCNPVLENAAGCSFASASRIGSIQHPSADKCFNWEEGQTVKQGIDPCTASYPDDWQVVSQCSAVTYGSCAETSVDIGGIVIQ